MRMQEALSILPFCTNELQEDDVHEINNFCMILGSYGCKYLTELEIQMMYQQSSQY